MARVAVTGMGVVAPPGTGVDTFWKGLFEGRSYGASISDFDTSGLAVGFACQVTDFEPSDHFTTKEIRNTDRSSQFGYVAASEAIAEAGGVGDDPARAGIVTGTCEGGAITRENTVTTALVQGYRTVSARTAPSSMCCSTGSLVSLQYQLRGPSLCLSTACSSGAHALGEAFRLVREGAADVVVAGGAEACITPVYLSAFAHMGALSRRGDDPAHASRPFDADRDGFVMSEGAGFLVLEEWEHAVRRGARPQAEMLGYGRNSDAYHVTAPRPGGDGARDCMRLALADAGLEPGDVGHVNAHGTSTPLNDVTESAALAEVFGPHGVPVTAVKSVTGHMIGAGGAVEAIAGIKAADTGVVPPTVNNENLDPECALDLVTGSGRTIGRRPVLSNSFGFGGHNVSLVFAPVDAA